MQVWALTFPGFVQKYFSKVQSHEIYHTTINKVSQIWKRTIQSNLYFHSNSRDHLLMLKQIVLNNSQLWKQTGTGLMPISLQVQGTVMATSAIDSSPWGDRVSLVQVLQISKSTRGSLKHQWPCASSSPERNSIIVLCFFFHGISLHGSQHFLLVEMKA